MSGAIDTVRTGWHEEVEAGRRSGVLKRILHRIAEVLAEAATLRCYSSVPYGRPWRDF